MSIGEALISIQRVQLERAYEPLNPNPMAKRVIKESDPIRFPMENRYVYSALTGNPAIAGGGVTVQWQSVVGKKYRLQYKNALGDADWTDVPGDATAVSTTGSKTDGTAPGQPTRFYRVRFIP